MVFRSGKLLLILLVPALVYGALKGVLYYNAKRTMDDIVTAAANQADIRYSDITTDLRGVVTVSGISVQPLGYEDTLGIDAVRIASDDPMFFIRNAQWQPGESAPPQSLSFVASGIHLPLSSDILRASSGPAAVPADAAGPCARGLNIDPQMLTKIGFAELAVDLEGYYRLDETARTLDIGMNMDLKDIESMQFAATMTDVDIETFSQGGPPQFNLGRLNFAVRVSPEFGRQALKTCAMDSDETLQEWSRILADTALAQMQQQGLLLGSGLSAAVREFYRDWGEFELVAAPAQPVGLLSLMFLPPDQLANALSLQLSLNDQPISDTSFDWQRPDAQGLSTLFGAEQPGAGAQVKSRPRRIIVRRAYEDIPVQRIAAYIGHQVQLKPRGLPVREGLLNAIREGEAEVQQSLHGGKFTVHVPLDDIESLQVLIRQELPPEG